MKVLIQGRSDLLQASGGDKVQVENTARELKELGVDVTISTKIENDLSSYDLVHVFQLDWTPETYFYAKAAYEAKKPIVLSPIHHSVEEVKKFDEEYVFGFRRLSRLLFKDQHHRDTFKNVYKAFFNFRKAIPTFKSVFFGLERMHKETLRMSKIVLVQTKAEASDLVKTYKENINWRQVPNGVSEVFLNPHSFSNKLDFSDYILCVGRIEPRKNQLNIINAVKKLRSDLKKDFRLVFVGVRSTSKHHEYVYWFDQELKKNPWIYQIDKIKYEQMPSIYKFCKVCVSASWFETTGLTSLEALFCGANAVASGERAKECLGDTVSYCYPENVESIYNAIKKEFFKERPVLDSDMKSTYTWKNAAKLTLEAYKEVLER